MGYPYPGGIEIDRAAQKGKPSYKLPRPSVEDHPYDMSFSGLKTAVLNLLNQSKQKGVEVNKEDLCASFQLAVCDILSDRLMLAQEASGYRKIVLAGGVSANSGVRARIASECEKRGFTLYMPPLCYCGDNAAMIGSQAFYEYQAGHVAGLDLNAVASRTIDLG